MLLPSRPITLMVRCPRSAGLASLRGQIGADSLLLCQFERGSTTSRQNPQVNT